MTTAFHEQFSAWVPYLFVYIGSVIHTTTPEQEREVITFLKQTEQHLIAKGYIQAVGFRYVGSV